VSGRLVGSPVFNTGVGLHCGPRGSIPCTSAVDPNAERSGVLSTPVPSTQYRSWGAESSAAQDPVGPFDTAGWWHSPIRWL